MAETDIIIKYDADIEKIERKLKNLITLTEALQANFDKLGIKVVVTEKPQQ